MARGGRPPGARAAAWALLALQAAGRGGPARAAAGAAPAAAPAAASPPPRGWRSWNSYDCMSPGRILTDAAMLGAMHAVLDSSRLVDGTHRSLKDLGFGWISMDDGWHQCNCSTRQDEDPTLPKCSVDECMGGKCTWHDKLTGEPRVNLHRFPDMKAVVEHGHALGLKVGGYLNNCICMEAGRSPTHYEEDARWFAAMGFDEVKIDSCGSSTNVSRWSELLRASGKPFRLENCHNGVPDPQRPDDCPMDMYRSGGDIGASFDSILGEAYSTLPFNDRQLPLSRPGCWAYPDMLEVGNFGGPEPLRGHEEQTHFGLWCVVSAPLVLGFNMTDGATMDAAWALITNTDALAVNEDWAGHPGTLVKSYPAVGVDAWQVGQAACAGQPPGSAGWRLSRGQLVAPDPARRAPGGDGQTVCVAGAGPLPHEPNVYANLCPPPTRGSGQVSCGLPIAACSEVPGEWEHNATSGLLAWRPAGGGKPLCLSATPQEFSDFTEVEPGAQRDVAASLKAPQAVAARRRGQLRVADGRRSPATASLVECPAAGHTPPPTSTFTLDAASGELRVGASDGPGDAADAAAIAEPVCLTRAPLNGVQLWSKPLSHGRVAILVVNVLNVPQALSVPVTDVPHMPQRPLGGRCQVRDVWHKQDLSLHKDGFDVSLAPHESAFLVVAGCHTAAEQSPVAVDGFELDLV